MRTLAIWGASFNMEFLLIGAALPTAILMGLGYLFAGRRMIGAFAGAGIALFLMTLLTQGMIVIMLPGFLLGLVVTFFLLLIPNTK